MDKRHLDTRIILLAIILLAYGITAGAAPAAAASSQQPSKTLHEAAKAGKMDEVNSFLLRGADVNAKDESGLTALLLAAIGGHKGIVEVLLAHGADVNAGASNYNITAAEIAMWNDHNDIVELLVSKGADVSALHLALHRKDQAKAKNLIEGGADVNKRTRYGTTPLHIAADAGFKDIARLLIDKGADVSAKTGGGETPLDYAMQAGHRDIAELLLIEQTRPLSGDLVQIALARKRLQPLTNHATPFEKKLLDMEELLAHLNIRDLLSAGQWDTLQGVKIKAVLDEFARQDKAYFTENPEPKSGEAETLILSMLKNAINEFLEAGRIFDEADADQDDDALFSKMLNDLGQRQRYEAQRIFTRLIKNLSDWQEKAAELEPKVAALEARLKKERDAFGKMGENNYKLFQSSADNPVVWCTNICIDGDVNRDGFNDVLICDSQWNDCTGRCFFFYGGKDVDFSTPDMILEGDNFGDLFGNCSGVFGDVNNDGYDDIVVSATGYNNKGRVYMYYGGLHIDNIADIIIDCGNREQGDQTRFGWGMFVSDIDNDGFNDFIVADQTYGQGRGRVYLFWGGETMDTTADLILEGEGYPGGKPIIGYGAAKLMVQGFFGRHIDAGGDVNGDGYEDILVGARHAGDSKSKGAAYLFFGNKKEDMDTVYDAVFRGEDAKDEMGSCVDLFDIDNDGFHDVIVGARFARNWRGAVYIWWGGKDFNGNRPADIVLEGELKSNMGGDSLICGDFNNDGYGDILAGAYNYPIYPVMDGRAYVFYGNERTLMDTDCDYVFDVAEQSKRFGLYVSAGDVNNDGYIDAFIAAEGIEGYKGKSFLYFGPFATEDLQNKIKAQQEVVAEVEKELARAKRELNDARKAIPSSTGVQEVFEGLPESLRRFLTPELEELHDETVASLRDGSFSQRDETRKNAIAAADSQLSPYIDELRQAIKTLESQDNKSDRQQEELKHLQDRLAWFKPVTSLGKEEKTSE